MSSSTSIDEFINLIWNFYKKNKRDFPWRVDTSPYSIFISEVMLQQTQTTRVVPKYEAFIKRFPDFSTLAKAPLPEILKHWSGLGYNRRALHLQKAAQIIMDEFDGTLPEDPKILLKLPGLGPATAASIVVFAFNKPYVFIETNIRRVFIHHFFKDSGSISDKDLLPLIEKTIDHEDPRGFYWALMDYGSYLGKQTVNPNRRSKHYTRQSKFEGSVRQARGKIIKILITHGQITLSNLEKMVGSQWFKKALQQLEIENFLKVEGEKVKIAQ